MRVKLRTILAGPEFHGGAGDVIEVPRPLGDDLVLGGYAELIEEERPAPAEPVIETATAPDAPEAGVEPRARKKRN